ncbi:MAG: protein kinase, partial [Candidatus Hydrogenedentales bacterium]
MAATNGARLGDYEILGPLGAGAMGEVVRARDTRLRREVAIKILHSEFLNDADRVRRFEREARILASLNHPNVAAVYDFRHVDNTMFIVMELVEGTTLADRLKAAPLPLDEALDFFEQISNGLASAHARGIVHRDLKPANILITHDGKVKISDFGLAKDALVVGTQAPGSPTIYGDEFPWLMSVDGLVIGTPSYMSPEQARGQRIDQRTDVWAFGACLFHALTGERPFSGETATDCLAAVLTQEPPWEKLPSRIPTNIRLLLRRCLNKNPAARLASVSDAGHTIREAIAGHSSVGVGTRLRFWFKDRASVKNLRVAGLILALVLAVVAAFTIPRSPLPNVPRQLSINLENPWPLLQSGGSLALSPDGRRLAYVAAQDGRTHLFIRPLDQRRVQRLDGTQDAMSPFFSPDGDWIGFFTYGADVKGSLRKVRLRDGMVVTLCNVGGLFGGAWNDSGHIIFANKGGDLDAGLYRVADTGGRPELIAAPKSDKGEFEYRFPAFLPDNRHVLFTIGYGGTYNEAAVALLDTVSGQYKTLLNRATYAQYVDSGHIVFVRDGHLFAAPFDAKERRLLNEPVSVLEDIGLSPMMGFALYSFSKQGLIVYLKHRPEILPQRQLIWVQPEESGAPLVKALPFPPDSYRGPRLSPDGRGLAVAVTRHGTSDILLTTDLANRPLSRLIQDGYNTSPVWTSNTSFVYASERAGVFSVYAEDLAARTPAHALSPVPHRQQVTTSAASTPPRQPIRARSACS